MSSDPWKNTEKGYLIPVHRIPQALLRLTTICFDQSLILCLSNTLNTMRNNGPPLRLIFKITCSFKGEFMCSDKDRKKRNQTNNTVSNFK